jgi:hypothetical protein
VKLATTFITISHGSVGLPLAGGDHAGFACRSAALVALAAEIDVIGFDSSSASGKTMLGATFANLIT